MPWSWMASLSETVLRWTGCGSSFRSCNPGGCNPGPPEGRRVDTIDLHSVEKRSKLLGGRWTICTKPTAKRSFSGTAALVPLSWRTSFCTTLAESPNFEP
ncbi:hypothetical protein LIER_17903 [Lithospermum erythrorhizon]|uniref:Secreted protein n=1 Tax=Lithospermum erythrorhizon TaxID=34254 RepID=A0AAV3QFA3_LITER